MVPFRGPIVDHENPFYCPDPGQFHSPGAFDRDSDVLLCRSPHALKPATLLEYNIRHLDAGTSSPAIYAIVHGRSHIAHRVSEKHAARRSRRKSANIPYDSSPCARYPSHLDGKDWNRKRARYVGHAKKPTSLGVTGGERKGFCKIKQEHSSPSLFPDQDEHIHATQRFEAKTESTLECRVETGVTTQALLLRLEEVFPHIGFREAADSVQHYWQETNDEYRIERHQALVDLLAKRGALNEFTLTALHDAEFRYLDLGPTMRGVNVLGLPRGDIMRAMFSQPGRFKNLKMLSFAGGRFQDDFALAHIRPFYQIEALVLTNTGIGNEGVFHIVALKRKLLRLELSDNPLINDDSVPALILFDKLQYLSVAGTGILMPGIRRLAIAMKESERVIDIQVPSECTDYVAGVHKQYLLQPKPPLISDPDVVSTLSELALARNLEAHAAINSSIVSTGPRNEMEERLRKILEVRTLDLAVREMLVGQDEAS